MYEWKRIYLDYDIESSANMHVHFESTMNDLEKEGWEVFEISPHELYGFNFFVRRSSEKNTDKFKELEERIKHLEHIIESERGSGLEI